MRSHVSPARIPRVSYAPGCYGTPGRPPRERVPHRHRMREHTSPRANMSGFDVYTVHDAMDKLSGHLPWPDLGVGAAVAPVARARRVLVGAPEARELLEDRWGVGNKADGLSQNTTTAIPNPTSPLGVGGLARVARAPRTAWAREPKSLVEL
eukprot:8241284-Pyramimonas_sp.AAC.1